MLVTVLIPTYRRTDDLERCLEGLKLQTQRPDEVLVVARDNDRATWQFLADYDSADLPLKVAAVITPGQVAALNQGLLSASGEIIAILDDDAKPHPQWLEVMASHFAQDPRVGGVGGRDWMYLQGQLQQCDRPEHLTVGRVQWFGRTIGNHHLASGPPREVDILKGANMSYRRSAIAGLQFDPRLLGSGAQVHNDLAFSLTVKRRGWRLIYDPQVAIDHFPGMRFDEDQRSSFNDQACRNMAHNETLTLLEYLPPLQRGAFCLWAVLIGLRINPGLIQVLRRFPAERGLILRKWRATMQGRWSGWRAWRAWQQGQIQGRRVHSSLKVQAESSPQPPAAV
jgi:cellulose synthase/poly-beta-1,6-N-acetylglucosamine synthase-like glycosyltransferase